jgi:hypothetical protein
MRVTKQIAKEALKSGDQLWRQINPTYRAKREYTSELDYWKGGSG